MGYHFEAIIIHISTSTRLGTKSRLFNAEALFSKFGQKYICQ